MERVLQGTTLLNPLMTINFLLVMGMVGLVPINFLLGMGMEGITKAILRLLVLIIPNHSTMYFLLFSHCKQSYTIRRTIFTMFTMIAMLQSVSIKWAL